MAENHEGGIRIVVIPGSVRPWNFTAKAVALVVNQIQKHDNITLDVVDLAARISLLTATSAI